MKAQTLDPSVFAEKAAEAARFLRALSNEQRLMILCRLSGGEMKVSALLAGTDLSQSALSQHLAVLRADGLVATRREGQAIHYRIAEPAVLKLIEALAEIFCPEE
ncbi:ArsR/SmtB family transcription factor [Hyphomonas sp.]|uniref:ArsR/SmtB family transcription factor n=1 Tax=Hyphomonas sp. TaxID=87 RepID=UPI003918C7E9